MSTTETLLSAETRTIDWQHHVDVCKHSGLSKAQYCRDHHLTYHVFIYWNAKLGDSDCQRRQSTGKLVPVRLGDSAPAQAASTSQVSGLQIHLPNGVRVSGIDPHSISWVGQLLQQL